MPHSRGVYRPENYDRRFHGKVSARTALASSLNIPAVRLIQMTGVEPFVELLSRLGFSRLEAPDHYGPSLALGAADLPLWELTNAYRTLARGGLWGPLQLLPDSVREAPRRVMEQTTAFLVSDMLSDREARSLTFGLENPLATRFWSAVKTGTSKDMRDNWCLGYSALYTVGVWVGNFPGDPMWNVTGMTGAAPMWKEMMSWLHRKEPSRPPRPPRTVSRHPVHPASPARQEYFLAGTEAAVIPLPRQARDARILYPTAGTSFALDPDMPPDRQKIAFEAAPASADLTLVLNGTPLGSAREGVLWSPSPGTHELSLRDGKGRVVDSVRFVVKGRPRRAPL